MVTSIYIEGIAREERQMTNEYLASANKAFSQGKLFLRSGEYNKAAQEFNFAKEAFQHYEHETGDKRHLSDFASRWCRTAIQKREAAKA